MLGSLGFGHQQFNIHGKIDMPDVKYALVALGGGIRFPVMPKLILAVDAKLLLPTSTGMIQDPDQYGQASVLGFDGTAGADYLVTPSIFVRAVGRFEVISYKFTGTGSAEQRARRHADDPGRDRGPRQLYRRHADASATSTSPDRAC